MLDQGEELVVAGHGHGHGRRGEMGKVQRRVDLVPPLRFEFRHVGEVGVGVVEGVQDAPERGSRGGGGEGDGHAFATCDMVLENLADLIFSYGRR